MHIHLQIRSIANGFIVSGSGDHVVSYGLEDARQSETHFATFEEVAAALPSLARDAQTRAIAAEERYKQEYSDAMREKRAYAGDGAKAASPDRYPAHDGSGRPGFVIGATEPAPGKLPEEEAVEGVGLTISDDATGGN